MHPKCRECGKLTDDEGFCPNCGTSVGVKYMRGNVTEDGGILSQLCEGMCMNSLGGCFYFRRAYNINKDKECIIVCDKIGVEN